MREPDADVWYCLLASLYFNFGFKSSKAWPRADENPIFANSELWSAGSAKSALA